MAGLDDGLDVTVRRDAQMDYDPTILNLKRKKKEKVAEDQVCIESSWSELEHTALEVPSRHSGVDAPCPGPPTLGHQGLGMPLGCLTHMQPLWGQARLVRLV